MRAALRIHVDTRYGSFTSSHSAVIVPTAHGTMQISLIKLSWDYRDFWSEEWKNKPQPPFFRHQCTIWHFVNDCGFCSLWSCLIFRGEKNQKILFWLKQPIQCRKQRPATEGYAVWLARVINPLTPHPLKAYFLCLQLSAVQGDQDIPRTGSLNTSRASRSQWRSAWPCIRQRWPRRRPIVPLLRW